MGNVKQPKLQVFYAFTDKIKFNKVNSVWLTKGSPILSKQCMIL